MQITRSFLREHGLLPRKSIAQHLLSDEQVMNDIVDALNIHRDDYILEIGAGCGSLTGCLLERIEEVGGKNSGITAVEIDERYVHYLSGRFGANPRFKVLKQDILKMDISRGFDRNIKVAGNIPYYISSPIMRLLFRSHGLISDIVVMLQKEVGMRIAAVPSEEHFGLLSVMRMLHYDARIVRHVDRKLFTPAPKVDSVIMALHVHEPLLDNDRENALLGTLRQVFSARRKMLRNTLKPLGTSSEIETWCSKADIDLHDRAENIDLKRWIRFLDAYGKCPS